jgi:hypothetical protein
VDGRDGEAGLGAGEQGDEGATGGPELAAGLGAGKDAAARGRDGVLTGGDGVEDLLAEIGEPGARVGGIAPAQWRGRHGGLARAGRGR